MLVLAKEARDFKPGVLLYYVVAVFTAILWRAFFLGANGMIFCASSLVSGILISALLPVTEVLAIICFLEKFQAEKGIFLALSLYCYVQIKSDEKVKDQETTLSQLPVTSSAA